MRLSLKIALRFLSHSRGQTLLILAGIAVGVAVQVFLGSLITSLQKNLIDNTIGSQPHITVRSQSDDKLITDADAVATRLENLPAGVRPANVSLDAPAFYKKGGKTLSLLVRGMTLDKAEGIYHFKLTRGKLPAGSGEVAVGADFAKNEGLKEGDTLTLLLASGKRTEWTISGVFDLGVASLNNTWVLMPLSSARAALEMPGKATAVEMQTEDPFKADTLAADVKKNLSGLENLETVSWKETNAQLLSGLAGQSASSYMIQVFVMLSVVLGIASVLAVSVMQKQKQLGILKAMGIRDRAASLIFLFQGLILGVLGGALGIGFGVGLGWSFETFARSADGKPIVPLQLDPVFIGVSAAIALAAATLAALLPARRSAALNPIDVIRNA